MRVALVIAPRGFKDESVAAARELFKKWGIETVIASFTSGECTGYHGATCKPDMNVGRIDAAQFDAILLIDGPGVDQYKLYDVRPLLDIVKIFSNNKKLIAGMNNAVKIIARANVIANTRLAVPEEDDAVRLVELYKGLPSNKPIEFDNNVLTTNDPSQAYQFMDLLLEKLGSK